MRPKDGRLQAVKRRNSFRRPAGVLGLSEQFCTCADYQMQPSSKDPHIASGSNW